MKDRCLSRDRGELSLKAGQVDAASAADVEDFFITGKIQMGNPPEGYGGVKNIHRGNQQFSGGALRVGKSGKFLGKVHCGAPFLKQEMIYLYYK